MEPSSRWPSRISRRDGRAAARRGVRVRRGGGGAARRGRRRPRAPRADGRRPGRRGAAGAGRRVGRVLRTADRRGAGGVRAAPPDRAARPARAASVLRPGRHGRRPRLRHRRDRGGAARRRAGAGRVGRRHRPRGGRVRATQPAARAGPRGRPVRRAARRPARAGDVVAANAPYVPTAAIATMPPEARDHEARVALDGGADGLDVQRRVIAEAPALARAAAAGCWSRRAARRPRRPARRCATRVSPPSSATTPRWTARSPAGRPARRYTSSGIAAVDRRHPRLRAPRATSVTATVSIPMCAAAPVGGGCVRGPSPPPV